MADKIKIGVLISGGGSNLQSLMDAAKDPDYPAEISCVISNKENAYGLERAENAGIPAIAVPHKGKTKEQFEPEVDKVLRVHDVGMICLAGFMRILSADFIEGWKGKILNIHPALLPKFGGEGMYGHHVHEAVLAAGETESGASVHIVTSGVDEGPIILQGSVPVEKDDTAETLAARVLKKEHEIYPQAVKVFIEQSFRKTASNS